MKYDLVLLKVDEVNIVQSNARLKLKRRKSKEFANNAVKNFGFFLHDSNGLMESFVQGTVRIRAIEEKIARIGKVAQFLANVGCVENGLRYDFQMS